MPDLVGVQYTADMRWLLVTLILLMFTVLYLTHRVHQIERETRMEVRLASARYGDFGGMVHK